MPKSSPAVEVAKEHVSREEPKIIELAFGVQARLVPVSAALIDEVTSSIKDPKVPTFFNDEKDREEENPSDPDYLAALDKATRERGIAGIDAMAMFGVELLDEIPDDAVWLTKLQYLEKRGRIDLSEYDMSDPLDREYVFKRYIAVTPDVIEKITKVSGLSGEEIEQAEKSFRDN